MHWRHHGDKLIIRNKFFLVHLALAWLPQSVPIWFSIEIDQATLLDITRLHSNLGSIKTPNFSPPIICIFSFMNPVVFPNRHLFWSELPMTKLGATSQSLYFLPAQTPKMDDARFQQSTWGKVRNILGIQQMSKLCLDQFLIYLY